MSCASAILNTYAYFFEDYYPELMANVTAQRTELIWFPHAAQSYFVEHGRWYRAMKISVVRQF
jgi:hypothetical protein